MPIRKGKPRAWVFAAVIGGGGVGAGLMGRVAQTHGSSGAAGAFAGAVLLGMLCHGVATGWASAVTLWAVLFGLFFAMIGPGVDDYGGIAVMPGALFGAFIGWLFIELWRYLWRLGSGKR